MDKLEAILEKIRPGLQADGGDMKLVNYDKEKGIVELELQGACKGCPLSQVTLQDVVSREIKNELPEVKEVRAV
jgi:Fe-S cluster biogenesis protein NfuA